MKKLIIAAVAVAGIVAVGSTVSAASESRIDGYQLRAEVEAAEAAEIDPFDINDNPYLYADMGMMLTASVVEDPMDIEQNPYVFADSAGATELAPAASEYDPFNINDNPYAYADGVL